MLCAGVGVAPLIGNDHTEAPAASAPANNVVAGIAKALVVCINVLDAVQPGPRRNDKRAVRHWPQLQDLKPNREHRSYNMRFAIVKVIVLPIPLREEIR